MELTTELDRNTVWERLTELVNGSAGARLGLNGRITQHQFVISIIRRRYTLPWRATYRGTVLTTKRGTLMTGKFDSNWALIFVGYPVLFAIFANVALNILADRAAGRAVEFTLLGAGACIFCALLAIVHQRDQQRIADTLHAIMTLPP